jgi:competence protein ComEC
MNELNRAPFVRLLIPFLVGIACGISNPSLISFSFYLLPLSILGFVMLWNMLRTYFSTVRRHYFFSLATFLLLGACGFQLSVFHAEILRKNHVCTSSGKEQMACIRIVSSSIEKEKTFKSIGEVELISQGGNWIRKTGRILIYLRKNKEAARIGYGSRLLISACLTEIMNPPNPGMFDYKKYLSNRNIHEQVYLDTAHWKCLSTGKSNSVMAICSEWRGQLLALFQQHRIAGKEYAVGSALLLGYEDKLDADILSAFSESGVLHVLSVSGLHVAIVYAVLNALLFFFDRFRYGPLLKAAVLLFIIWIYAALSGLSPSVLRSVAMFSFIIAAKAFNRNSNVFNTLAASAFLLLCIDPLLLMDAGFQLSYIAVAGIVAIQPLIYRKWETSNWLLDQAWTLISVSIAAQAVTFPLALYYFHQFPNYFLITNLLVIPLSTLVMYSGIALFVFHYIPLLGEWSAWVFRLSLQMLNACVEFFASLPYASWKGLFISVPELLLLYALVAYAAAFLARPFIRHLQFFLVLMILFVLIQCWESYCQSGQGCFIVYAVPKTTAIDFIEGKRTHTVTDSEFCNHPGLARFYVQPFRQVIGADKGDIRYGGRGITMYAVQGKRLLLIREGSAFPVEILKTDYLVLSKGAKLSEADLIQKIRYRYLILDSSCTRKEIDEWKKVCSELKLDVWIVSEKGAFVETFS